MDMQRSLLIFNIINPHPTGKSKKELLKCHHAIFIPVHLLCSKPEEIGYVWNNIDLVLCSMEVNTLLGESADSKYK